MTFTPDILLAARPPVVHAGWLDALGPLVLIVVYVARQIMSALAEQREAERARQRQANQQAKGDNAAEAPQRELRSEVDAFLERVNQARQRQEAGQQDETKPQRGPVDPFEEPVRRKPKRPTEPSPAEAPIELLVEATPPTRERESRSRGEQPTTPPNTRTPNTKKAESSIASTDERTEARLHEKFDHQLGRITGDEIPPLEAKPGDSGDATAASRIRELLSRPGGVREAVVLSEILQRRGDTL